MKTRPLALVAALSAPLSMPVVSAGAAVADQYDVILRGGTVHDGRGGQPFAADVALKGDRIAAIGDLRTAQAGKTIDVHGLMVAPGFIDGHSHFGDHEFLRRELAGAEPLLAQGVTTVFINPDGWGLADLRVQRAQIEKAGPGVNAAPMIGHKPVRIAVLGMADRAPTSAELEQMAALMRTAFARDGAFGLSSGLIYAPANFAKTDELIAMARVAAEFGGFYHSHIRDEGTTPEAMRDAVDELITIARTAKLTGIVTHIKVAGPRVWGKAGDVIRTIEAARAEGLSIWADQYPYEAGTTYLASMVLPGWAQADGPERTRARLADPATRARIRAEAILNLERRAGAAAFQISEFEADRSVEGRRLDEIARAQGMEPVDAALRMIERGEPRTIIFSMRDDDVVAFMRQPWTMTASDGFGVAEPHPRSYGTFTRKLQTFALERKVISLQRAIHSMTGQPAEVLGLRGRGRLEAGAFADVVVFDPAKLRERSTYQRSRVHAEGMVHVFVNGQAAIADGKPTGVRAGRVLSRNVRGGS